MESTIDNKEPINIDDLLEQENTQNKAESWNKLNKTMKIQKLNSFSEKYGKEHNYNKEKIKQLQAFFVDILDKKKLQTTKDVVYNKITKEVTDIPGLFFHPTNRTFTLRADKNRPSTLKSLGPTRKESSSGKKKIIIEVKEPTVP